MASSLAMTLRVIEVSKVVMCGRIRVCVDVLALLWFDMNVFAILTKTGKRVYANDCDDKCEQAYPRGCFLCIDYGMDVFVRRGKLRA